MYTLSRRHFLQGMGMLTLSAALPMRFSYANTPNDNRLLVIILRGAMDGLAAVIPYGDSAYADARRTMAIPQNSDTLLDLDGYFALSSALAPLMPLYQEKELVILHAAATAYRDRSHFAAQNLLENGSEKAGALNSGWLNRATATMENPYSAIALGATVPLLLQGDAKVTSWAPSRLENVDDDFIMRVLHMYQDDPLLMNAISEAQTMQDANKNKRETRNFIDMMKKAASFMSGDTGPRIGAIDFGGWDTHANQGLQNGRLANHLRLFAEGLTAYRSGMGETWKKSAVIVVTEFGRTVRGNGTGGTDHGTAGVAFLLGGSVNGGRVVGDWPGLSHLYEGRDLTPANDLRSLLKGTLSQHLLINDLALSTDVFPGSGAVPGINNLFIKQPES